MGAAAAARPRETRGTAPRPTVRISSRQGGAAHSCSALTVSSRPSSFIPFLRLLGVLGERTLAFLFAFLIATTALGATAPGTVITNRALIDFVGPAGATTVQSNEVSLLAAPTPTRAAMSLLRTDPGRGSDLVASTTECRNTAGQTPLPPPLASNGTVLPLGQALPLSITNTVHGGEALFLDVLDLDRNRDSTKIDHIDLTLTAAGGDTETVVLEETAVDSGRFVGYVQTRANAATPGDCVLQVQRDSQLAATYADPANAADMATATALVDPFSRVFDSRTGASVDGAHVRLVNAATGTTASVLGDDGASRFPAEIITGQPVTDSGGTVYSFPAGVFRFPLVAPGDYRLEIEPPQRYGYPSQVAEADLQTLPSAPYRLAPASFGGTLPVSATAATAIDIPLDPVGSVLQLDKTTQAKYATVGDFVPYVVAARNASDAPLRDVVVTDVLPPNMRYQKSSARLESGAPLAPEISADGRTLTFRFGTLAAGSRVAVHYVAVVATGGANQKVVNRATAAAGNGVQSNEATATVQLREELFQSKAVLLGRVVEGACDAPLEGAAGVPGVRVYLEDGRYAVTDNEGKYHFEGLAPGSHVAQLDTITLPVDLEPLRCGAPVRRAGNAISQFVDARGGGLVTADFVLARRAAPTGDARLGLTTTAAPEGFTHAATVTAKGVPLSSAELLVLLPVGLEYVNGNARVGDARSTDPEVVAGALRFTLGALAADTATTLSFSTRQTGAPSGISDLPVRVLLRFSTPTEASQQTAPVVNVVHRDAAQRENERYTFSPRFNALATEIDAADRDELERIAANWRDVADVSIQVVGHSDQTPIAAKNRARFTDNYALSRARAQVVADDLRKALPNATFIVDGRGAEEPIDSGTDAASLARNRRVEIEITGLKTVAAESFAVAAGTAEAPPVATAGSLDKGSRKGIPPPARDSTVRDDGPPAPIDLSTLEPKVAWLQPAEGFAPAVPSIRVAIEHLPEQRVTLTVNGRPISALNFDGVETNAAKTVALSRWRGVDLVDGDNKLVAVVHAADGSVMQQFERVMRYGSGGVRAELVAEQSLLTADGRTEPVLALRVFDASGQAARPGTLGAYKVDPPYRTAFEVATLRDNPLLSANREPTFAVGDDGLVRIALEPTVQTGAVVLRLRFNERQEQEIRAWLTPEQRDWILVGIAEGTAAYTKLNAALEPPDVDDGYSSDGRIAFFAKGRVKGSTLLTIAYDSARDRAEAETRLFGTIEPDRYYSLYGDAVEQRFEAASTRKLYLKIERRALTAMFGDFQTGFTLTELGRYSRSLTGLKADFAGKHVQVSAFAADNRETYGRDEFLGDGTSGPYKLSRTDLVANSDKLRIEVRDRIRSEVIVETQQLARFVDYSIDYLTGVLTFKQPIAGRDPAFNPVYIVAEYETLTRNDGGTTAGARATTRLAGDKLELGATLVEEGSATGDTRLAGTDLRYRPTGALEVRAEVAQTDSANPLRGEAGAYVAEIKRVTERLDLQAYVREQQPGFGVGQQLLTETGTHKVGMDAHAKLAGRWTARGEAFRQENLTTGADRELVSAEARHESDDATESFGVRRVVDDLPATAGPQSGEKLSELVSVGGSRDLANDRITLRALTEQAVNHRDESLDFPERTTLGVDYHFNAATTLFGEVEDANGANIDARMTRIGVRSAPWSGTQLASSVSHEFSENGPRVFANMGLTQSWRIGSNWAMDAGLDQSQTLTGTNTIATRPNPTVPLVTGNITEDYTATFVGGQYRADLWTFTSRLERRDAQSADRWAFLAGFFREPVAGRALSLTAHWLDNDATAGASRTADTRFSYAYRPIDSRLVMLDRLDLESNDSMSSLSTIASARLVNNLNLHWQVGQKLEIGTQVGARFTRSTIDGERYAGWTSLLGIDLRRDLTKMLDIGLHATELHSFAAGTREQSIGVDVGINAAKNLWLSVGYNFQGFRDEEFDASRYTAAGPYIRFRFKTDQDSLRDLDLSRLRPGSR